MPDPILHEARSITHGVLLRPVRPTDDPALARVIRAALTEFGATGEGFSSQDPEIEHISRAYRGDRTIYYVLDEGGRVLGGAGIGPLPEADPGICELRKMYVQPAGRNRGLGRALMERCLDAARRLGYRKVYLETLQTMHQARALYTRHGFAPVDAPLGATGHPGCNRWFLKVLDAGRPPIGEGERWVEL